MTSKAEYLRKKQKEWQTSGERVSFWRPKPGVNMIRILPPFNPENPLEYREFDEDDPTSIYFREYEYVYSAGEAEKKIIPRAQFGFEDCPFEEYRTELERRAQMGDKLAQKRLKRNTPQRALSMWIIDRAEESKGPQYWETTPNNGYLISNIFADSWFFDIDRPLPDKEDKGARDLKVVYTPREEAKNGIAKYEFVAAPKATPLHENEQIMLKWLSEDLWKKYPRLHTAHDADYIRAVINGTVEQYLANLRNQDSDDDEPEDAPSSNAEETRWWASLMGESVQITVKEIEEKLAVGDDVMIMPLDQSVPWQPASAFGFKAPVKEEVPTKPPAGPPAPPPPVVPSAPTPPPAPGADVGQQHTTPPSEVESLQAQIAALQAQQNQANAADGMENSLS